MADYARPDMLVSTQWVEDHRNDPNIRIVEERKRREVDPTLAVLRQCVEESEKRKPEEEYTRERLLELLHFLESMSQWYDQMRRVPTNSLRKLIKMGSKVQKMVG